MMLGALFFDLEWPQWRKSWNQHYSDKYDGYYHNWYDPRNKPSKNSATPTCLVTHIDDVQVENPSNQEWQEKRKNHANEVGYKDIAEISMLPVGNADAHREEYRAKYQQQ
jgi:hypothetical protein